MKLIPTKAITKAAEALEDIKLPITTIDGITDTKGYLKTGVLPGQNILWAKDYPILVMTEDNPKRANDIAYIACVWRFFRDHYKTIRRALVLLDIVEREAMQKLSDLNKLTAEDFRE
jgi:hypothetical protein